MSDGFVDFDAIEDLPEILHRLGPVSGGDILVFRQDVFTDDQRGEIAQVVLDHYTELARQEFRTQSQHVDHPAAAYTPLIVFLPPGASLEHLSESDMLRAGWQRTPEETT